MKLLFAGVVGGPFQVAVETAGNLYLAESVHNQVLKLPPGSNSSVELPSAGLRQPEGVAPDTADNVYVANGGQRCAQILG